MIKKLLKKLMCFTLVTTLITGTSSSAMAQETTDNYDINILQETSKTKIVQTSDDNYTYIATFDKQTKTLQLVQTNISTGEVKTGDTVPVLSTQRDDDNQTRASLEEKTFTNYEYEITYGTSNTWELRRPGDSAFNWVYFKTKETNKNKEHLTAFRSAVDNINKQEGEIIGAYGLTALSLITAGAAGAGAIFTGGTLSPAAWTALLSAAGFSTAYAAVCMAYDQSCKDAYHAYFNTYYSSTTI